MLKRNGQLCQRSVPDYSGRLTDFEFLAYNTVFTSVEEDFKQLSAVTDSLTDLEHSFPRLLEASGDPLESLSGIVPDQTGTEWYVIAPLLKFRGAELLFCRREVGGANQFAIVERLDPNSSLAKAQGVWQLQMTSNDARLLLQDFIEGERQTMQLYAQDIVGMSREAIEEKYPERDLGRVIKAISQRCTKKISTEEKVIPIQTRKQSESVRI
ncbi:MAG: hypothetical protein L0Z50_16020 [Verrucomicrobiales bacterium]|nr:hypothetical protein [Verrucomicrobiales bacterium]